MTTQTKPTMTKRGTPRKQQDWTPSEEQQLKALVERSSNIQAACAEHAKLTGRTQAAVSQHYYKQIRKNAKKAPRVVRVTKPQPSFEQTLNEASVFELLQVNEQVVRALKSRMQNLLDMTRAM